MALRDQPYFPLYVQDYLTDEKLNMCSASTQGVYIKILCVFHKSEKYGGILLKQKDKQKESTILNFALKLVKLLPFDMSTIESALIELLDENVLKIDNDFMYQKRMVKDNEISIKRAEAGQKGGQKSQEIKDKFAKAKRQAKGKANTEYESDNEIDNKNKNVNVIDFPFDEKYKESLLVWFDYKKQIKDSYKTTIGKEKCYKNLVELSKNNPDIAKKIVDQSIANNWKGLFELKQNTQTSQPKFNRFNSPFQ